jgi:Fe2+ or Zn2+ uptake regulation protein
MWAGAHFSGHALFQPLGINTRPWPTHKRVTPLEDGRADTVINRCPRDHLVRVHCSRVFDFTDSTLICRHQAIAEQHLFRIDRHSLVIHGARHRRDAN